METQLGERDFDVVAEPKELFEQAVQDFESAPETDLVA